MESSAFVNIHDNWPVHLAIIIYVLTIRLWAKHEPITYNTHHYYTVIPNTLPANLWQVGWHQLSTNVIFYIIFFHNSVTSVFDSNLWHQSLTFVFDRSFQYHFFSAIFLWHQSAFNINTWHQPPTLAFDNSPSMTSAPDQCPDQSLWQVAQISLLSDKSWLIQIKLWLSHWE